MFCVCFGNSPNSMVGLCFVFVLMIVLTDRRIVGCRVVFCVCFGDSAQQTYMQ